MDSGNVKSISLSPRNIVVAIIMALGFGGTVGFGPQILNTGKNDDSGMRLTAMHHEEIEHILDRFGDDFKQIHNDLLLIHERISRLEAFEDFHLSSDDLERIHDDLLLIHERVSRLEAFEEYYLLDKNQ